MYKIEGMSHTNETDVDDPRSRQPTAWEPPIPTKANSSYGAPPAISPIQNKPSALATYGDNAQKPYDLLAQQNYEQAWSSQSSAPLPDWQEQHYAINAQQHPAHTTVKEYDLLEPNSSKPLGFSSYDIASAQNDIEHDRVIATLNQMEQQRKDGMFANPIFVGNPPQVIEGFQPMSVQSKTPNPSYFQRAKHFVWSNTQRRVTTLIITTLIIGGIIGAYLGTKDSNSSNQNPRNCTYPEGVNQKFTELQSTLTAGSTGLTIPGLDPATCSLISSVINNTVSALKMGGYACWQNVQSALAPLATSALALNMASIAQIITALKQYCFPPATTQSMSSPVHSSVPTAMSSSVPVTSPPNTFTTFKTIPTTSTPTTTTVTTTTTAPGTTAITTSTSTPTTTVTSTVTSTSTTAIQTTTTSLVTTSTGTTTTLAPSTITTLPPGTTTVTTLVPTTTATLFVSSSTSTTIQTTTTTTKPTTTTTLSTTPTTTTTTTTTATQTTSASLAPCSSFSVSSCPTSRCSCAFMGLCGYIVPCGNLVYRPAPCTSC